MVQYFLGVTWDTEDLVSCKQAVRILFFHKGAEVSELFSLDFGNLDVEGVLDEEVFNSIPEEELW